jgi:DNA-binding response OmpR family regulator
MARVNINAAVMKLAQYMKTSFINKHTEPWMQIACYTVCTNRFKQVLDILASAGFGCQRVESHVALMRALRRNPCDLIVADVDADLTAGAGFYAWLHCRTANNIPVVLLSSTADPRAAARALNAGADEFISQPCDPAVFLARVHRLLRRSRPVASPVIHLRGFTLDRYKESILDRGIPVELTRIEFALAWLFFSTNGRIVSYQVIRTAIWGSGDNDAKHKMEHHVYKLRKKLGLVATRGVQIGCAYSEGYYLELRDDGEMSEPSAAPDLLVANA